MARGTKAVGTIIVAVAIAGGAAARDVTKKEVIDMITLAAAYDKHCERLPEKTLEMLDRLIEVVDRKELTLAGANIMNKIKNNPEKLPAFCAAAKRAVDKLGE
jgi:hypothetical protein